MELGFDSELQGVLLLHHLPRCVSPTLNYERLLRIYCGETWSLSNKHRLDWRRSSLGSRIPEGNGAFHLPRCLRNSLYCCPRLSGNIPSPTFASLSESSPMFHLIIGDITSTQLPLVSIVWSQSLRESSARGYTQPMAAVPWQ